MRPSLTTALLASTILLTSFAAQAGTADQNTKHFGAWMTSAGKADNGVPMCVAALNGTDRSLFIKYNNSALSVQLFKSNWNFPNTARINVNVQVDNAPILYMEAVGIKDATDGTSYINFTFNSDQVDSATGERYIVEFDNLLRSGLNINFNFPDGTEPSWTGSLNGSNAAMTEFNSCAGILNALAQPNIQAAHPAPAQPTR